MDDTSQSTAVEADPHGEDLFGLAPDEHLGPDDIERGLSVLLGRYPQASVSTMKGDGVCVQPPPELELGERPLLTARSGLDLVAPADRLRLLATWDDVLSRGASRCLTHLADDGSPVTMYGFDLRARHDIVVVVYVPAEGEARAADRAPAEPALPRFATIAKDERSFVTDVDEALTQILGWQPHEIVGRRSIEFIHPDDHPLAIDNWMEMLASPGPGRRVRLRHRRSDGGWVWFEVTNHNLLDDPDRHAVVSEMVDISEEMAAHEELRARKELLDRIAEAMPVGLLHLDADRHVVYTNDRLHEILERPREQTAVAQLADVLADDRSALLRALDEVLAGKEGAELEIHVSAPSAGATGGRLCAVSVRPLSDGHGGIAGAVACITDVTESARMREELQRRATYDELTGCYNRASITRLLDGAVGGPSGAGCAVMFADLDDFKQINDRLGHGAGDQVLRALSARLRVAVRAGDHVGRLGGDEFLVVCPDVESREAAAVLATRIERAMQEPVALEADVVWPTVSVGVAWSPCGEASAEELVARADDAMYEIKHSARHASA